ncbi:Uncharacterized protein, chloroplastic [Vitis vinifera]|uniref:Uncharacterized protein, chloroplastic n=1 Tax=Vitis vinifera TaxID=29760 RepID=A0A438DDN0_VITVI|nr:Uncharacterized protein, chloroplastic [Vitis vinifera]
MGHNRGWEEAASMFSGASIELKTCNAALLEATGKSWEEVCLENEPLFWGYSSRKVHDTILIVHEAFDSILKSLREVLESKLDIKKAQGCARKDKFFHSYSGTWQILWEKIGRKFGVKRLFPSNLGFPGFPGFGFFNGKEFDSLLIRRCARECHVQHEDGLLNGHVSTTYGSIYKIAFNLAGLGGWKLHGIVKPNTSQ